MAASSCCGVLGSGKVDTTGNMKDKHAHRGFCLGQSKLLLILFQMHVAELLASHGASLNAKTFLEETPIGKIHNLWGHLGSRSSQQGLIYRSFFFYKLTHIKESFPQVLFTIFHLYQYLKLLPHQPISEYIQMMIFHPIQPCLIRSV